jgi:tRNA modification GTPase
LIGVLAEVEAAVDFADEDVDDLDRGDCAARMAVAGRSLQDLLDTAFVGRILDEGLRTAIVGRPNVGKSSLLNRLVRRERAIVSEVPGTTRDTVEEMVEFAGVPVVLIDTAGIRVSEDVVEQLGVERSRVALEAADLVLVIVDLCAAGRWSEEMFPAEVEWFLRGLDPARTVIVGNKVDIAPQGSAERLAAWAAEAGLGGGPWRACSVSASTGRGVDELRAIIDNLIAGADGIALEEPMVSTERQRTFVAQAVGSARRAEAGLAAGSPEELVAEDIRAAAQALGAITGEELNESLIDEIFSRFCVGK